jgi:alkylation response protein AidB-like acyl-CoA dehydrogenase
MGMDFRVSDELKMLKTTCARFFAARFPADAGRRAERGLGAGSGRDAGQGFDPALWKGFCDLGVLQLTLPEAVGGAGLGQGAAAVVAEEIGRALYQSPWADTVTAADIIVQAGPAGAGWALLEGIAAGACTIAMAVRERGQDDPAALSALGATATAAGDGFTISGRKLFVPFGETVDRFMVAAATPHGPTMFLVPRDRAGIQVRRGDDTGRSEFCSVEFAATPAGAADVVGAPGGAAGPYTGALARARVRHAAYLVGLCQGALDVTIKYTKEREQFGRAIASFQAISFRLAALAARIDAARHLAGRGAWLGDGNGDLRELRRIAAEALAMAGELARDVTAESMQMHGSFGFSEEAEPQRYYRRAAVDALLLGTPVQLRDEAMALLAARAPA